MEEALEETAFCNRWQNDKNYKICKQVAVVAAGRGGLKAVMSNSPRTGNELE